MSIWEKQQIVVGQMVPPSVYSLMIVRSPRPVLEDSGAIKIIKAEDMHGP